MTNKTYEIKGTVKDHKGESFKYEVYKTYRASSETYYYTFALYDDLEEIGSFEFEVGSDGEYASTYDSYLNVPFRGRGLYQEILLKAKDYFHQIGLKGIVSKGKSRSYDATTAWDHVKGARKEADNPEYRGKKLMNYYLESEGSKTNIITRFNDFKNNI